MIRVTHLGLTMLLAGALGLAAAGCSDDDEPATPDTTEDTNASGDAMGDGDGSPQGACMNPDDREAITNNDVSDRTSDCGVNCIGSQDDEAFVQCVTDCLVDSEIPISEPCATCFGESANCAKNNCQTECTAGTDQACSDCRQNAGCNEVFSDCAGGSTEELSYDDGGGDADAGGGDTSGGDTSGGDTSGDDASGGDTASDSGPSPDGQG